MRLLVTGGAGFIGSNYVRMTLGGNLLGVSSIVVLDKLTYAGVAANLSFLTGQENFQFIKGDICDSTSVTKLLN